MDSSKGSDQNAASCHGLSVGHRIGCGSGGHGKCKVIGSLIFCEHCGVLQAFRQLQNCYGCIESWHFAGSLAAGTDLAF